MRASIYIFLFMLPIQLWAGNTSGVADSSNFIFGKVFSSATLEPMTGVEIVNLHTGEKSITTSEGSYKIGLTEPGNWLRFNYPGYTSKQRLVNVTGECDVFLFPLSDESVDMSSDGPFGNTKRFKTSSYQMVSGEKLAFTTETNFSAALNGHLAGFNSKHISGMPGEGGIMNIRGISSIFGPNRPLVVLDGIPIQSAITESHVTSAGYINPLSAIDVNDIERIEVYAEGASLYGLYGGQGLIVVDTRKPTGTKTKVDFKGYSGMTFNPEFRPMLNATQHKTYLMNLMSTSGLSNTEILESNPWLSGNPLYYYYYNYDNNTQWQDEVFNASWVNKYNVSLQGGDEIAKFSINLGYLNQKGVVIETDYQRYNFRLNASIQIIENLKMETNIGFSYHIANRMDAGPNYTLNPINTALLKSPMLAPYLRDNLGNKISVLSNTDIYGFSNPTAIIKTTESNANISDLFTNVKMNYELSKNSKISSLINLTSNTLKENAFLPDYGLVDFNAGATLNMAAEGIDKTFGVISETRFDFKKQYEFKHFISFNTGVRVSWYEQKFLKGSVFNTPTDEFKSLSSVTSVADIYASGEYQKTNRSEIFAQSNYRFKDKYLLDVVLNLSASSNIGEQAKALELFGGKWGFFPSVHAAWLASSESFLRNYTFLDVLKIRSSITFSGNDFYSAQSRYSYSSRTYGTQSGIVRNYLVNQKLTWEKINQMVIGADASMFNERLNFSLNGYKRTTDNLLNYRKLPIITGYDYYWENNGTLSASGFDASVQFIPVKKKNLQWRVGVNIGMNHTKLNIDEPLTIDIPGGQVLVSGNNDALSFYGLATQGVFRSNSEATQANLTNDNGIPFSGGDVYFIDYETDQVIDANDKIALGSLLPKTTGGIHMQFDYKQLSVKALFDFASGHKIFNYSRMLTESFSGYGNQSIASLYSWKSDGYESEQPRINYGDPVGNMVFSDRWLEDGQYFRLKEITVSYKFPKSKIYNEMELFVTGQNLFTLTKYLGYSPDFAYSANPLLQNTDYGQTPVTQVFIVGFILGL